MTSWDIQPQGVQGQLQVVGTHAGDLEKALNSLVTDMQQAAQAAGTAVPGSAAEIPLQGPTASGKPLTQKASGPVGAALAQYMTERQKSHFEPMAKRIQAAVIGAATATNEYVQGDLDQAKEAQDAARQVNLDLLKELGGKK
ncbi:DUF6507 family protein [Streptomyces ficellus]|uniref:Uncharacterized protein n=1 Tax=Streptomyces ficellus TaxID=1977088 RepID=A0A6I6F5Y8_9ACTN|nr:DUF6507 family protein [Streptomyces ficellus]QGV79473.1 hypothetical protein EIZ62_15390 [Streptomyces ficellus]